MTRQHQLIVQYRIQDPFNTGAGWYWAAWNSRNGHAEGGPFKTEAEAEAEGRAWERDEFE